VSESTQFQVTLDEQIAVSLCYVAYSGSGIPRHLFFHPDRRILDLINTTMPNIPVLCSAPGEVDWRVVWGPAVYTFKHGKYQDNAMFVVQRISRPSEYVVAIRGTNGTSVLDWIEEDLRVFHKKPWEVPDGVNVEGDPQVSESTQIGLDILLNQLTPESDVPGGSQNLASFLTSLIDSDPVDLRFTGHSLGGALAPTLALWFRQSQGLPDGWDPYSRASISAVSFAGPTAGNVDFAALSDRLLGDRCLRIHNTLDIVPHGWDRDTLATVPDLYKSGGITMDTAEKLLFDGLMLTLNDYEQIERSIPMTWKIQPGDQYNGFFKQAGTQHFDSYPSLLDLPELTSLILRL
jgi:hypothetical protein